MVSPPAAFRDALAALSPERFRSFAADVWRARGFAVRSDDRYLVVSEPMTAGETRLLPLAVGDPVGDLSVADTVVRASDARVVPTERVDTVGPGDIYERIRYGLDGAAAERIADDYLGGDLPPPADSAPADSGSGPGGESIPEPTGTDSNIEEAAAGRWSGDRRSLLVTGGALVAGLGVGTAGGAEFAGTADEQPGNESDRTGGDPRAEVGVPGLSSNSVTGPRRLADTHLRQLESSSFTLDLRRSVQDAEGRMLSSLSIFMQVDESRNFTARMGTEGPSGRPLFGDSPANVRLYATGDRVFNRVSRNNEVSLGASLEGPRMSDWFYWSSIYPYDEQGTSVLEFYAKLLERVPVRVSSMQGDGEPPYGLYASNAAVDSLPGISVTREVSGRLEDLNLVAMVTEAGLVKSLNLSYVGGQDSDPISVDWSIEYRDVGQTKVRSPGWAYVFLASLK